MEDKPRILIVDDEPSIVRVIADELAFEGFEARSATEGPAAVQLAASWAPQVVLLDVMLPGMNGFEICRELRRSKRDMWVILLTSRSHEADRVRGLEQGADDYVIKPFSLRELLARVRVGLRRLEAASRQNLYRLGDLDVDVGGRMVTQNGREIVLTRKEFDILVLLLRRAGEVVSRDDLCNDIWGEDVNVTERVIDTHVFGLRRKIEPDPNNPVLILSVRGVGYKLVRNAIQP
jgi:DNA-binding response OmpR family regulator